MPVISFRLGTRWPNLAMSTEASDLGTLGGQMISLE